MRREDTTIRSIFTRESQLGIRAFTLLMLAIAFMVMDIRIESFANFRAALTIPVAPLQYVISMPIRIVDSLKSTMSTRDTLLAENLQLKSDQLLLRSQLQRLAAIESENIYLKSLLSSSKQIKSKSLIAEILAIGTEPFVKQVVLDKGTHHGVFVGQPVLDAFGVMGQVTQVGLLTSRVLLVSDPKSGIAVQDARNGVRVIASGDSYSGKMRLMYVPKTADIRIGDLMMTSGLGGHYPEGYPVGRVVSVNNDPNHQFSTIYLEPSAHLDSSRQVLLIWYQRNA